MILKLRFTYQYASPINIWCDTIVDLLGGEEYSDSPKNDAPPIYAMVQFLNLFLYKKVTPGLPC